MGKTVWLALIRPTPVQTAAIHGQRESARAAIASMDRSYSGSGQHRDCGCSESPAGCSGRSRPAYWPSQYLLPGGHELQKLVQALRCSPPQEPGELSGGVVMIRRTFALRALNVFALAVSVMVAGT